MKHLKYLSILVCFQGLAVIVWFFQTRSENENALIFGLSPYRLVLLAVQIGLVLLSIAVTIRIWRSPKFGETFLRALDAWCLDKRQLGATLLGVVFFLAPMLAGLGLIIKEQLGGEVPFLKNASPYLELVFSRIQPLFVWFLALILEGFFFLIFRYRHALFERELWNWQRIKGVLVGSLILVPALIHWLILGFQLTIFVDHPAWYWAITNKPITARAIIFTATGLILTCFACWLLVWRCRVRSGLLIVFLTGVLLQYGIGYLEGGGLSSLRDRYFTSHHRSYVEKASQDNLPVVEMVRDYENVYGKRMFTSTKPPGLMVFYVSLERLLNGNPPQYSQELRFERISWAITAVFPVVAMLLVFGLYWFPHRFFPSHIGLVGFIAPVLLITCPNFLLLGLFADQAIYPILFLAGAWLAIETVRKQTLLGAFLLGIFLYLAIFFAFTMLPLIPLTGLYLLIHYWLNRNQLQFSHQVKMAIMMAAGVLLLYLLLLGLLEYNFFTRFGTTVSINRNFDFYLRVGNQPPAGPEPLGVRIQQAIRAASINNLEFATVVGWPLYFLFAVQAVQLVGRWVKRSALPADGVMLAFLLTFIVLNIAGTAQGEVGRLWMFWLPMVLFFAAFQIEQWVKRRPYALLVILLLQFGTVVLTYQFQDLVM